MELVVRRRVPSTCPGRLALWRAHLPGVELAGWRTPAQLWGAVLL